MNALRAILFLALQVFALACMAAEELVTTARYANGEPVPYILNTAGIAGTPPKKANARVCEPIQSGSVCVKVASA